MEKPRKKTISEMMQETQKRIDELAINYPNLTHEDHIEKSKILLAECLNEIMITYKTNK